MEANQFLGLIKFFGHEAYLDKLIAGYFHSTPPEVYRLEKREGVSDKFESCSYSYRPERGDEAPTLRVNGHDINDILGITAYFHSDRDSWMHCWFTLRIPKDEAAVQRLNVDLEKMKKEFGNQYAFIPAPSLKPLVERLKALSSEPMYCGEVKYSANRYEWGNLCKALEYSYQREYRFLFGECSTSELQPYVMKSPKGFDDLILKNPEIKLESPDNKVTYLSLGAYK